MKNTEYNSNITKEDLQALGDKPGNIKNDNSEDELLKNKVYKTDFTGKDLDIPGRNLSKPNAKNLIKDEENEHYSLGSQQNENLEIDTINNNSK